MVAHRTLAATRLDLAKVLKRTFGELVEPRLRDSLGTQAVGPHQGLLLRDIEGVRDARGILRGHGEELLGRDEAGAEIAQPRGDAQDILTSTPRFVVGREGPRPADMTLRGASREGGHGGIDRVAIAQRLGYLGRRGSPQMQ